MADSEIVGRLLGMAVLDRMPAENKTHVAQLFVDVSETKDIADGEALIHEGYLAFESGYVLVDGVVSIDREDMKAPVAVSGPALLGEMSQFSSRDLRSATVTAKGPIQVLRFSWEELYGQAKERLTKDEQAMLMDGIERLVWQRFGQNAILDLPLFRDLDDELKLRVCLVLPWITERAGMQGGQMLFRADSFCNSKGYLLTKGEIVIVQPGGMARSVVAPDIIGIIPKHDPVLRWSGTATTKGDVEFLKFSWDKYIELLQQRLSAEDQQRVAASINAHAREHYVH